MNSDSLENTGSSQHVNQIWDSIIETVKFNRFFGDSCVNEIQQLNDIFQKCLSENSEKNYLKIISMCFVIFIQNLEAEKLENICSQFINQIIKHAQKEKSFQRSPLSPLRFELKQSKKSKSQVLLKQINKIQNKYFEKDLIEKVKLLHQEAFDDKKLIIKESRSNQSTQIQGTSLKTLKQNSDYQSSNKNGLNSPQENKIQDVDLQTLKKEKIIIPEQQQMESIFNEMNEGKIDKNTLVEQDIFQIGSSFQSNFNKSSQKENLFDNKQLSQKDNLDSIEFKNLEIEADQRKQIIDEQSLLENSKQQEGQNENINIQLSNQTLGQKQQENIQCDQNPGKGLAIQHLKNLKSVNLSKIQQKNQQNLQSHLQRKNIQSAVVTLGVPNFSRNTAQSKSQSQSILSTSSQQKSNKNFNPRVNKNIQDKKSLKQFSNVKQIQAKDMLYSNQKQDVAKSQKRYPGMIHSQNEQNGKSKPLKSYSPIKQEIEHEKNKIQRGNIKENYLAAQNPKDSHEKGKRKFSFYQKSQSLKVFKQKSQKSQNENDISEKNSERSLSVKFVEKNQAEIQVKFNNKKLDYLKIKNDGSNFDNAEMKIHIQGNLFSLTFGTNKQVESPKFLQANI